MKSLEQQIKKIKQLMWERGEVVRSHIVCSCGHKRVYEGRKGEEPKLIVVLDSNGFPINED